MIFEGKYFLWFILFTDQILLPDRFYFEIFSNMFIAIICFPFCDQISKITLALSSSRSATHGWNGLPTHSWNSLYKDGGVEFSKFSQKLGGSSDFSHKKGEVGKIGGS